MLRRGVLGAIAPRIAAAGGGGVPFALDGFGEAHGSGATIVIALTTTNGQGTIVVTGFTNAASITSVVASGLTFTARHSFTNTNVNFIYEYTAPYSSNFSGNITVTPASAAFGVATAFGISGTAASPVFDVGGPQQDTGSTAEITTTAADTFIYHSGATSGASSTIDPASNFIELWGTGGAVFYQLCYRIATTPLVATVPTFSAGASSGALSDAILKA